jgi:uncharacterized protein YkwD
MPRRFLLCAAAASAVLALPASPAAAADCAGADARLSLLTIESARSAIVCLVNNERTSRGLNALEVDRRLQLTADLHSADMVLRDFFDHVNPDGLDPFDRMEAQGYDFWSAGENIAAGQPTPREAMEGWMASEGHCRNILSDQYTEIGVGIDVLAATFSGIGTWTQNFGRPEGTPKPSNPHGVDDECPVHELATPGTAAPDTPATDPGTSPETPGAPSAQDGGSPLSTTDFPAGTPTALTATLKRFSRRLTVRGRLAADDGTPVRIRIRRGGKTVLRVTVHIKNGRYGARIKTPAHAGRLRVIVRAAGQRVTRFSAGR